MKEHFENLFNQAHMSIEEAESGDLGEDQSITLAEVAEVVKKLHAGKEPGVENAHPEVLKEMVTCLFNVA